MRIIDPPETETLIIRQYYISSFTHFPLLSSSNTTKLTRRIKI